jgi:serine protease Do
VKRVLTTIAVLVGLSTVAGAEPYSRHGWWSVVFSTVSSGEVVCSADATYTGGTYISMGAKYGDGGNRVWELAFSNAEWKWIKSDTDYRVTLYAPSGPWTVTLKGTSDHSLFAFVDKEVINALAMDRTGSVSVVANNRTLGTFRLDESAAAIRDVVHCLQANAPSKTTALPSEKKQESGPSSGTGFFVADGYVLTNYHVIKDCTRRATVSYPNYKPQDAYNAGADETNDLALLSTKMQNRGTAEFRYQPKLGEAVAVYGFPFGQILATEGNFTLGNVTSVAGLGGDSRHFQISAPIQPGNSGGPVMDASGRVTGVAISSLDTIKMVNITGHVPQNVNFAISASIAINFLGTKDVAARIADTAVAQKLEPEKLAEVAKKFTVHVWCE